MKMNIATAEIAKSVRKNWGTMSPVTKRINSKKLYMRNNKWGKSDWNWSNGSVTKVPVFYLLVAKLKISVAFFIFYIYPSKRSKLLQAVQVHLLKRVWD